MRAALFTVVMVISAWASTASFAQEKPGFFESYEALDTFVTQTTEARDYARLLNRLGGGDEYTIEQMNQLKRQLDSLFPTDFDQHLIFSEVDLGGGIRQEGRAYYNDDVDGYLWFYFLLHDRGDAFVVIEFSFNTNASTIISRF
ncbi:hypothetical protein [Shimia ponticola]|uniref:hypothetical protein n=1 Tax=Shimia ponticola TaxID=2582893 RepID=UPI0011BF7C57|nr:hypothetical protein [Shimia ponticola]